MRIAVWYTKHEIADTVAQSAHDGLITSGHQIGWYGPETLHYASVADINIAYGILRGTADVFKESDRLGKPWIHLDRGYFNPGHYDGYYRISLRGSQQTTGLDKLTPDYDRLRALNLDIQPWRGFDDSKPVLICPATSEAANFFGVFGEALPASVFPRSNIVTRKKGDPALINFHDYNYVLTFNSSVGWQALAAGIPCVSDSTHSIVGAWFKDSSIESLPKKQEAEREQLFGCMANLQLTLDEIREGKLWEVVSRLLSTSATIPARPNALMSPPIASSGAHLPR